MSMSTRALSGPLSPVQAGAQPRLQATTACFSVSADVDPGIMPRVLEVFAKRGLVPSRWVSDVLESEAPELAIDVQLHGLEPRLADLIAQTLRQMPGVRRVLTAHKGRLG